MTTTKPPVLTDDEIYALIQPHPKEIGIVGVARAIEQAVLERAGADAVRDAALEEAARELEKRRALLRGQYESVNITEADAMYGLCIEAIRALKVTPAAAVADRDEADDLEDAAIRAMEAKGAAVADDEDIIADIIANHAFHDSEHGKAAMDKWQMRDAAKDILAHFAAPQLSGNAGEVDVVEIPLPSLPPSFDSVWMLTEGGTDRYPMYTASQMEEFARAAIAASKGANHG